jgi:hypothetical protein
LTVFRQLSRRGNVLTLVLGADVNPTIPSATEPDGGVGPISPGAASWPYRALPPPPLQLGAPVGLTIIDSATTRSSINRTRTAPSTGDPADASGADERSGLGDRRRGQLRRRRDGRRAADHGDRRRPRDIGRSTPSRSHHVVDRGLVERIIGRWHARRGRRVRFAPQPSGAIVVS